MKKFLPIIVFLVIIGGIVGSLIYVFTGVVPIEDSKKLSVSCNGEKETIKLYLNDKVEVFKDKSNCTLELSIRDIDRTFVKLKSNKFLYYTNAEGDIDETGTYSDIVVDSDSTLVIYGADKETKFEFRYK